MEGSEQYHDSCEEADISDAVDDKGLHRGVRSAFLLVPMADKQIRADADQLPPHIQQEKVVGKNDHQHGKREQPQIRKVAGVADVPLHVADGEVMNKHADKSDHHHHYCCKIIDTNTEDDFQRADARYIVKINPSKVQRQRLIRIVAELLDEDSQREHERRRDSGRFKPVTLPRQFLPEEDHQREPRQRKEENEQ